ncbi:helix-turn-helix transcriptional regulator [Rhizobium sp. P44RR-XXIV]|uniref:AraC family transcriptional regulator n=1 Tax=Rhizobium sp. P44RR-XXIV TaxID=1921145 RepID=UPI000986B2AC|nr:helix-turn-helix transcriptional regulator [Rhizobium sp. P44RR-XXIV]TIX90324.1 AraC family transcriptional regulator [Rhizobium sp. P44RR-XXIV]
MTLAKPPGLEDPDKVPRSVVGLTIELASIHETDTHQHKKAQLLYVISGAITVEASNGVWTVPPHCAIWIPSGIPHVARSTSRVTVGSLYIDPALAGSLSDGCGILFVQPLLRELLLRFIATPALYPEGDTREARLVSVLLDELQAAPLEPLRLPMPTDRRLRRLAETLVDDPALRFTIEEWGARVGASNRTLTRLFQRETGMSFGRWRQQLHIGLALQRLASGQSVTNVAFDLGYESTSAFIAMFRRMLGTTPARYFTEIAEGEQDREVPEMRQSAGAASSPGAAIVDFKAVIRRKTKPQS